MKAVVFGTFLPRPATSGQVRASKPSQAAKSPRQTRATLRQLSFEGGEDGGDGVGGASSGRATAVGTGSVMGRGNHRAGRDQMDGRLYFLRAADHRAAARS